MSAFSKLCEACTKKGVIASKELILWNLITAPGTADLVERTRRMKKKNVKLATKESPNKGLMSSVGDHFSRCSVQRGNPS